MPACQVSSEQPKNLEAQPRARLCHVGGHYCGAVQFTRFDVQPNLHKTHVGEIERTLGKAEPLGHVFGFRQRRLRVGEVAAD